MRAAIFTGTLDLSVEDVTPIEPGPSDVVVRIGASGVAPWKPAVASRFCSRVMSFGDFGRNVDSCLMKGEGAFWSPMMVADVDAVPARAPTDRSTSLKRLLPADCRSSNVDVAIPVRAATQTNTPMTANRMEGSM